MMTDELIIAFNSWVGEWWWVHLHHIDCIVNLVYCWLYNVYCWLINDIQSIYNRLYIVDYIYIYCWLLQLWWWWWWAMGSIDVHIWSVNDFCLVKIISDLSLILMIATLMDNVYDEAITIYSHHHDHDQLVNWS